MTCIVGLVNDGCVYMAGDSAGVADTRCTIRNDPKIFKKDGMLYGFSGSFRFGQIVRYEFKLPKKPASKTEHEFLCTTFANKLRALLERRGALSDFEGTDDTGDGNLLIGWHGKLYKLDRDFQIGESADGYDAIGSGDDVAKGAVFALRGGPMAPKEVLTKALEAATYHCTTVRPPYVFIDGR